MSNLNDLTSAIKGLTETINGSIKGDKSYQDREKESSRGGDDALSPIANIITSFMDKFLGTNFSGALGTVKGAASFLDKNTKGKSTADMASEAANTVGQLSNKSGAAEGGGIASQLKTAAAAFVKTPHGAAITAAVGAAVAVVASGYIMAKLFQAAKGYVADWSAELQQMNKQYEGDSGGMAAVMSNREVMEMLRRQRIGENLSGSADLLTGAEQRRKDQEERLFTALGKLENSIVAVLEETVTQILIDLKPITERIAYAAEYIAKRLGQSDNAGSGWDVGSTLQRFNEEQQDKKDAAKADFQRIKDLPAFPRGFGRGVIRQFDSD